MKDIHEFCAENGLHYTLAYGSMIGAIRHNGFIPWDDDIDILMPRKDWECFSAKYKSVKGYKLLSAYDKKNYMIFSRVYDTEHTIVKYPVPTTALPEMGVWVDVLPLDGLPNNVESFPFDKLQFLLLNTIRLRENLTIGQLPIKKRIKRFVKSILYRQPNIHRSIIQFHKIARTYTYGTTELCSNLCCRDALDSGKMEVLYTSDFSSFQLMPFEDTLLYVASGYDRILKMTYGDYMQLPPKDQQVIRHSFALYYKKD